MNEEWKKKRIKPESQKKAESPTQENDKQRSNAVGMD